jgi:tetratricopeptide (TPR) repeat protein
VFAVQDEIAAAVVEQLKVTLLDAAPKARKTDPKAYALYLQGRELEYQYSTQSLEKAIALYQQALAIDGSYAPAWDRLVVAYFGQVDLDVLTPAVGVELMRGASGKALAADPNYAPAYGHMAMPEAFIERNYDAAARHVEQGLALDPSNLDIISVASSLARRLGRLELAIDLGEYVASRDPVNIDAYDNLGLAYRYAGQLDKSIAAYRTLLSLSPEAGWQHTALGFVLLRKGEVDSALEEFEKEPVECFRLGGLAAAYRRLGRNAESDAATAEVVGKCAGKKPFSAAGLLAARGDVDGAFAMLEKAAAINDLDLGAIVTFPAFDGMRDDPRWLPFMRRLGLAPEQLDAIKLDVKVPG